MTNILVVEDEPGIAFALDKDLRTEGYQVAIVTDGAEAVRRACLDAFDLIIMDVALPRQDGFQACREIRAAGGKTPIIVISAVHTHEMDKIYGLDIGADDYVTKPFSLHELRARIRAVLRRTRDSGPGESYSFADFTIDLGRFELRKGAAKIETSSRELRLLTVLLRNRGRVVSRELVLREVWGTDVYVSDRVVDNHIVSLRRKIEDNPIAPVRLITIRGEGYRFDG